MHLRLCTHMYIYLNERREGVSENIQQSEAVKTEEEEETKVFIYLKKNKWFVLDMCISSA